MTMREDLGPEVRYFDRSDDFLTGGWMRITGRVEQNDLLIAQWVHVRPRTWIAVAGLIVLILLAWSGWIFLTHRPRNDSAMDWYALVGVVYIFVFLPLWVAYRVRRTYRQRKDLHLSFSITPSNEGMLFETEQGHATKPWSDYLKWKEGGSLFLLYLSDSMFQMVPKRLFTSPADVDAFRRMLKEKVGA